MRSSTSTIIKLLPGFETRNQVIGRQRELIRALGGSDGAPMDLARMLDECAEGEPCSTAICPVCVRELRESFVLNANKRVAKLRRAHEFPISAFSAILIDEQHGIGDLYRADLTQINKRLQRQYQRKELPLVFAGIDISLNEDGHQQKSPFWQIHVYGVVVGSNVEALKHALKRLYPPDQSTPRPFLARECTDLPKALSYAIKPFVGRRVGYLNGQRRRDTNKVPLKRTQLRELATWLGQYPLAARYLLIGCRRYGDRIELNPGVKERLRKKIN
jgi:hypothetical protein